MDRKTRAAMLLAQQMTFGKGDGGRARPELGVGSRKKSYYFWSNARPIDANGVGGAAAGKRKRRLEAAFVESIKSLVRNQPTAAGSNPPKTSVIPQTMANTTKFP
jgi:hypothetical protein